LAADGQKLLKGQKHMASIFHVFTLKI